MVAFEETARVTAVIWDLPLETSSLDDKAQLAVRLARPVAAHTLRLACEHASRRSSRGARWNARRQGLLPF